MALAAVTLLLVAGPTTVSGLATASWQASPHPLTSVEVVLQSLPTSCGPALIATLSTWYGRPLSEAEVLAAARLRVDGVTLGEFARLATMFGVGGTWRQVGAGDLRWLPTPFVAHLVADGADGGTGHLVAVLGLYGAHVVLADPATGPYVGPVASFERRFTGRAFVLWDRP